MSVTQDCQFASLAAQGFNVGTLNDRTYAWLAAQTGVPSGLTLNDQWVKLLTDLGYSGDLNDMQVQSWVDIGYTGDPNNWPDAANYFWCINGGVYGPAVRIVDIDGLDICVYDGTYNPDIMEYDGTTGFYSRLFTSAGNEVTLVQRIKIPTFAGAAASQRTIWVEDSAATLRATLIIYSSDFSTAGRRNKISLVCQNTVGSTICRIFSTMDVNDDLPHVIHAGYDAVAGTGFINIDGADDTDTGNAEHTLLTGTLANSAGSGIYVGADSGPGNFVDGLMGFVGYKDDYLTGATRFMTATGPKELDEVTWPADEWDGQPEFWNEDGEMDLNQGSGGPLSQTGTITKIVTAIGCTAAGQYQAIDTGFTNPADTWVWELISGGPLTNDFHTSYNTDTGSWGNQGIAVLDAIGLDRSPNKATTATDAGASSEFQSLIWAGLTGVTTMVVVYWIKADNDETRFPRFDAVATESPGGGFIKVGLNTKTGHSWEIANDNSSHSVQKRSVCGVDWWRLSMEVPNLLNDSTSDVAHYPAFTDTQDDVSGAPSAQGSIVIGNVERFTNGTLVATRTAGWVYSEGAAPGSVAGAVITSGSGTDTVTVQTQNLAQDWTFALKVTATDSVSTDTANVTTDFTHYHREDLTVSIQENTNDGCTWPEGDPPGCTANASYTANISGGCPSYSIVWSLSAISGGTASIISGQGTGSVVVQTVGSTDVQYDLTCTVTSEYQTGNDTGTFTQTHAEEVSGPAFHALTPDTASDYVMEGVLVGTGDLTQTHTAVIYALDFQGVYQKFPANAELWANGRAVLTGGAGTDVVSVHGNDAPAGSPLAEVPYLKYQQAAQNDQIQSNDLTNVEWTATTMTVAQDETGLDGTASSACTLTATAGNATVIGNAITAASATHATAWHIKRKTGTGTIELTVDGGTTWQAVTLTSSYQRFAVEQATVTNPAIGIRIVTSGDAVIVGNAECHLTKDIDNVRELGPIFTTTAAVATDSNADFRYDPANHDNTKGVYYIEFMSSVDPGNDFARYDICGGAEDSTSLITDYDQATGQMRSKGSAQSLVTPTVPWTKNTLVKIGVVYDSNTNQHVINIDGEYGNEVTFTGFALVFLGHLFYPAGADNAKYIREFRRYEIDDFDAGKTLLDGLMA